MTPDDDTVPDDDAVAGIARRALRRLGDGTAGTGSWADVQSSARRAKQRRLAAAVAVCAVVLAGSGVAAAVVRNHDPGPAHIASPLPSSTTSEPSSTTSTSSPPSTTTAAANTSPTSPVITPPATTPTTGSVPPPSDAPLPNDFSGVISIGSSAPVQPVDIGSPVDISTIIRNTSSRTILPSSATAPTALATVCSAPQVNSSRLWKQSLWWMTNAPMAPGAADGRSETFTPDSSYEGIVICELDVVRNDTQGVAFDTSAGGDAATVAIVGTVTGVPPVTVWVVPTTWTVTTLGAVGPLQFGVSTDSDVRGAVGTPNATAQGTFGIPSFPDYDALGYDCTDQETPNRLPLQVQPNVLGPFCTTIFYVNVDTKTLVGIETMSNRYATERGTTVGMATSEAESREGQSVQPAGCRPSGMTFGAPDNPQSPGAIILHMGTNPTDLVTELSAEDVQIQVGVEFC